MSPSIWTQCGAKRNLRPLKAQPWRIVEAQHVVSTNTLVDSLEEQDLLERLVEEAKPPLPKAPEFKGLHYLLATPFRHPPLPHGSRFGTAFQRGIWYGSETQKAAFAEHAYYRFVFRQGTTAQLGTLRLEVSVFQADIATDAGVDLTRAPFAEHTPTLASKVDYTATQALGTEMREAGVEAFRFTSAREQKGTNVGVLTPKAFAKKKPRTGLQTWLCVDAPDKVEFQRLNAFEPERFVLPRRHFEVDGALPSPAA